MNKKLRTFVYPVCAFIVLLLLWQVCVMLTHVRDRLPHAGRGL